MLMLSITDVGLFGVAVPYPGSAVLPVAGPIVQLTFTLPLAGPVPSVFDDEPQSCQSEMPNVQLVAQIVDQVGNAVDISAARDLLFWLMAPDGTVRPVGASFYSNGLDGCIAYTTNAQDLGEAGLWKVQAQMSFGASVLRSRWGSFCAEANVPDFS